MKFTLLTSFYNGENFIEQLYKKIKSQTYKNWEWVVTDDFSNDNGREKLLEISKNDRRVIYVEQYKKKEMFWNPQNFCKDSEIIVQLDQDDYPLPKALEVYHHFFTKFPEVILITCAGNMFNDGDGWRCFYNLDYRNDNNMSCGKLTFLRAWRHNPNVKIDYNPNDWMRFYFNDLAIICKLEEMGKVLNLPRNLYFYNYRENSISHESTINRQEVNLENERLISEIKSRRHDEHIDTIVRYFDPIYDITHSFMSHDMTNSGEQIKISYHLKDITTTQKNLLKELFFDFDININKTDGNEDYLIWSVKDKSDIENFLNFSNRDSVRNTQIVIHHFNDIDEGIRNEMLGMIKPHYPFFFQVDEHMTLTLLR
jgi:glycosyltransferase involved in cell wall biosynthesis